MHLTDQDLSLSVPSVTVGGPEMEVPNSSPLISDIPYTKDLETSLNPVIMEPGWLESLASS